MPGQDPTRPARLAIEVSIDVTDPDQIATLLTELSVVVQRHGGRIVLTVPEQGQSAPRSRNTSPTSGSADDQRSLVPDTAPRPMGRGAVPRLNGFARER